MKSRLFWYHSWIFKALQTELCHIAYGDLRSLSGLGYISRIQPTHINYDDPCERHQNNDENKDTLGITKI